MSPMFAAVLATCSLLLAWRGSMDTASRPCAATSALRPLELGDSTFSLAGQWSVRLTTDTLRRASAALKLTLVPRAETAGFYGWADSASPGIFRHLTGDLTSRDPERPGAQGTIQVYPARGNWPAGIEITVRFRPPPEEEHGPGVVSHDGVYAALRLRKVGSQAVAGTWQVMVGEMAIAARGTFCAVRSEA